MWSCNDVVAADSLLSATLERRLRLLGESHEDTLRTMASLGQMRHQQLRVDEATKLLEQALAGQMRLLGDQHPHTMQTMMAITNLNSLAEMSNDQDGHTFRQDRVSLAKRVYCVLRDTKGALHIETLVAAQTWLGSALGLGVALSQVERAELEEQLQQAMGEAKEALGSTHRIHVGLASMLRSSMLVRGCQDEAAEFMRTLQIDMDQDVHLLERMFGSTHMRTRCGVQESANCLRDSGDYTAQVDVLHELVDRTVRAVGVLDPETFSAKTQLARAFSGCGKPDKASQVYEELLPQQQRVLGPLDTATLDTHRMCAHALMHVDPYKAEPVFRSLLEATKQVESSSAHDSGRTGASIIASVQIAVPFGSLLLSLQRYQEAVEFLEENIDENNRALEVLESNADDSALLPMLKPMLSGLASMLETAKAALSVAESLSRAN
jgi:tetratricopeptide (TPR) repeat protein